MELHIQCLLLIIMRLILIVTKWARKQVFTTAGYPSTRINIFVNSFEQWAKQILGFRVQI